MVQATKQKKIRDIRSAIAEKKLKHQQLSPARRLTISGVAGGLILVWGLSGFAGWQWQVSQKQRILSQSLISENLLALNLEPETSVTGLKIGKRRQAIKTLRGHSLEVISVAFSPDGKTIATGSSPDGKIIATGSWDKTVKLWNFTGVSK